MRCRLTRPPFEQRNIRVLARCDRFSKPYPQKQADVRQGLAGRTAPAPVAFRACVFVLHCYAFTRERRCPYRLPVVSVAPRNRRCGSCGRKPVKPAAEDIRFRVMRLLQDNPDLSQRQLSRELGISLGAVNYCLRALVDKGEVKIRNFRAANNKMRYAYILTPRGLANKAEITRRFLARKMAEYEALKAEIEALEKDIQATTADGATEDRG